MTSNPSSILKVPATWPSGSTQEVQSLQCRIQVIRVATDEPKVLALLTQARQCAEPNAGGKQRAVWMPSPPSGTRPFFTTSTNIASG